MRCVSKQRCTRVARPLVSLNLASAPHSLPVYVHTHTHTHTHTIESIIQCRAIWYTAQCFSRNEQFQKLGAICIPFMMDDFPKGGIDYEFIRKTSKVGVFGFLRIVSAYILCRSPAWNGLTDLLAFLFGNRIKLRTRPIGGKFVLTLSRCSSSWLQTNWSPDLARTWHCLFV